MSQHEINNSDGQFCEEFSYKYYFLFRTTVSFINYINDNLS